MQQSIAIEHGIHYPVNLTNDPAQSQSPIIITVNTMDNGKSSIDSNHIATELESEKLSISNYGNNSIVKKRSSSTNSIDSDSDTDTCTMENKSDNSKRVKSDCHNYNIPNFGFGSAGAPYAQFEMKDFEIRFNQLILSIYNANTDAAEYEIIQEKLIQIMKLMAKLRYYIEL